MIKVKPSDRASQIQEYFFSKKLKEIRQMKAQGKPVINLGIGSPDLAPDEAVNNVLTASLKEAGSYMYQPYQGLAELRKAASEWYHSTYNVRLSADDEIIPLMGSKEGIGHISLGYLQPGDKVLIPNPGYPTYAAAASIAGAEVVYYNLTAENNWYPDFEELEALADENVKLMWLNYPHMPTTQAASLEVFEKLVEFAKAHNILLCHDNPYSLTLNPHPISIFNAKDAGEVAIELNSLSKSHSMAGARIGFMCGHPELMNPAFKVYSNFSSGMFLPLQKAAVKALELGPEWQENLDEQYGERKKYALQIMESLNCDCDPKGVGMFVWGRVKDFKDGVTLSDKLLYESNVFITPGVIFGSNGDAFVRISLCAPVEDLKEALGRIEKVMAV